MFFPILIGLGAVGLILGMSRSKSASASDPQTGQVWTLGLESNRELSDNEWPVFMAAMKQIGDVMGVTRNGKLYVITIRYTSNVKLPPLNKPISLMGDSVTLRFAQRAPIN